MGAIWIGTILCLGMTAASRSFGGAPGLSFATIREAMQTRKDYKWTDTSDEKIRDLCERALVYTCRNGLASEAEAFLAFGVPHGCRCNAPMKAAMEGGNEAIIQQLTRHGALAGNVTPRVRARKTQEGRGDFPSDPSSRDCPLATAAPCMPISMGVAENQTLSEEQAGESQTAPPCPTEKAASASLMSYPAYEPLVSLLKGSEGEEMPTGIDLQAGACAPQGHATAGEDEEMRSLGLGCRSSDEFCPAAPLNSPAEVQKSILLAKEECSPEQDTDRESMMGQKFLNDSLKTAMNMKDRKQIGLMLVKGADRRLYLIAAQADGRSRKKKSKVKRPATDEEVQEAIDWALVETAASGSVKQMKDLIMGGANPSYSRDAPLRAAMGGGHCEAIVCLMDAGAVFGEDIVQKRLAWASSENHYELVERLTRLPSISKTEKSEALVQAVTRGHVEVAGLLLRNGADPDHQLGISLVYAASYAKIALAELLLDHGASHCFEASVKFKFNPLTRRHQCTAIETLSTKRKDPVLYYNALIEASLKGHSDIVDLLAQRGSDLRALGDNAIHHAVRTFSLEAFQLLLFEREYSKASLNMALKESLLDTGKRAFSQVLIERGADPLETALEMKSILGDTNNQCDAMDHKKLSKMVLSYALFIVCKQMGEPYISNFVDSLGQETFDVRSVVEALLEKHCYSKVEFLLVKFDLPVSFLADYNFCLLLLVKLQRWDDAMQQLERVAHPIEILNEALLSSLESGPPDFWRELLECGAMVEVTGTMFEAMRIAASAGHLASICRLIVDKADPSIALTLAKHGLKHATRDDAIEGLEKSVALSERFIAGQLDS